MSVVDQPRRSRSEQVRQLVEDFLRRRMAGESIGYEEVLAEHPELMPELGEELRKAERIGRAYACADVDSEEISEPVPADVDAEDYQTSPSGIPEQEAAAVDALAKAPDIPGYEILSKIHHGGQGIVYKAIQKATKRTVAIKVLLHGADASPLQQRRFEREIDLVASLRHPNIVTVYDSGVTRGHHYFAMEYIHGDPLDVHVSKHSQTLEEMLRLFVKICAAVNHAHQHGVIHRDLKPSNIRLDASGEPHILDFGLAKAAGPSFTYDGGLATVTGEFMGTLAYASPEQTKGDPFLVDIRSDVYSLGVIVYEMLTGHYPYPVIGHMTEVMRNIAEAAPEPPSSWHRRMSRASPGRATRTYKVKDELETIVLKALAKERERRYQSVEHLLRDVERYLTGEPIEAKRDSAWYVIRKLAARHVYATVAVVSLAITIISFSFISIGLFRQTQQALRAKALSDSIARQKNGELAAVGESTHPAIRSMTLGWFLLDWGADRLDRARAIGDQTLKTSPERAAMTYLLDETYTLDKLLSELPADHAWLGYFAAGERYLKQQRHADAVSVFEKSLELHSEGWLAAEAQARLQQLHSKTPRAGTADLKGRG